MKVRITIEATTLLYLDDLKSRLLWSSIITNGNMKVKDIKVEEIKDEEHLQQR